MITDWSNYTITENGVTYALNNLIEVDTTTPATLTIADGINTIFTNDDIITATYRKNIHGADVEEISKLYLQDGGVKKQIGKVYNFDGTTKQLIYNAEFLAVKDNTLQNGVSFTVEKSQSAYTAITVGAEMALHAYAGDYFGMNVAKFSTDIREFSNVNMTVSYSGGDTQERYNPCMVVAGTLSQLKAITFTEYNVVNFGGCKVLSEKWNIQGQITFSASIADLQIINEPVYLGVFIGTYNDLTRYATVNYLLFE